VKTDYQRSISVWSEYYVEIGIRDGVVSFVFANVQKHCWLCP